MRDSSPPSRYLYIDLWFGMVQLEHSTGVALSPVGQSIYDLLNMDSHRFLGSEWQHVKPVCLDRNYGTFVPMYFRSQSQEQKFHRWNLRSLEHSLPGVKVTWNLHSQERKWCGTFASHHRYYRHYLGFKPFMFWHQNLIVYLLQPSHTLMQVYRPTLKIVTIVQ